MPPVELRSNFLFGLVILLAIILLAIMLVRLWLAWANSRAARYDDEVALKRLRHTKEWFNSLLLPILCSVVVLWALAFIMTGWVISGSSEDPVGVLEETPEQPGQLYTGDNNPKIRKEELRQEGDELIKERKETLDEFRENFFDTRKEVETDETPD